MTKLVYLAIVAVTSVVVAGNSQAAFAHSQTDNTVHSASAFTQHDNNSEHDTHKSGGRRATSNASVDGSDTQRQSPMLKAKQMGAKTEWHSEAARAQRGNDGHCVPEPPKETSVTPRHGRTKPIPVISKSVMPQPSKTVTAVSSTSTTKHLATSAVLPSQLPSTGASPVPIILGILALSALTYLGTAFFQAQRK